MKSAVIILFLVVFTSCSELLSKSKMRRRGLGVRCVNSKECGDIKMYKCEGSKIVEGSPHVCKLRKGQICTGDFQCQSIAVCGTVDRSDENPKCKKGDNKNCICKPDDGEECSSSEECLGG